MPHEGYAIPITNDGPGFHSDTPVSELTETRHSSHRGKWRQLNPSGCGNHGWGYAGNHETDPERPLVAWGLRPPDTDSRIQLTAQVAGGTDTDRHPDWKRHNSP